MYNFSFVIILELFCLHPFARYFANSLSLFLLSLSLSVHSAFSGLIFVEKPGLGKKTKFSSATFTMWLLFEPNGIIYSCILCMLFFGTVFFLFKENKLRIRKKRQNQTKKTNKQSKLSMIPSRFSFRTW